MPATTHTISVNHAGGSNAAHDNINSSSNNSYNNASSHGMNNNNSKTPEMSPYVVSLSRDGGGDGGLTRNHLLPPLAGDGPSTSASTSSRKGSSRSGSSKNHRHHGHPHHHRILHHPHPRTKTSSGAGRHGTPTKRSYSAAATSNTRLSTPVDSVPSSPNRHDLHHHHHHSLKHHGVHHPHHLVRSVPPKSSSHHHHRTSTAATISAGNQDAFLRSPKSSRSRINKIDTVRVLRTRPLFYPMVKERYSSSGVLIPSSGHRSRSRAATASVNHLAALELPFSSPDVDLVPSPGGHHHRHHVTGKKISLRADPKRKKKSSSSSSTTNKALPTSSTSIINL